MSLKVVILSTETLRHTYFINRLAENFDVVGVFYEKEHFQPPFPVSPLFEAEEEAFEQEHFFNGKQAILHEQVGPVHFTNRVHNPVTVEWDEKTTKKDCLIDRLTFSCID